MRPVFLPLLPFLLWTLHAGAQTRVPFEPTPMPVVQAMVDLAAVKAGDVVYDLGCGDGRVVIAAAQLGARAVCVDIDPQRIAEARENARKAGVAPAIAFRNEDLFATELGSASVVMLFLSPQYNRELQPKLRGLKPGTRIVSHEHDMGAWKPQKRAAVRVQGRNHSVLLWVVE